MKNAGKINGREIVRMLPPALPQSCILNSGKEIMKKTKKRKLFYCKRCTGKFSKDFVKKMDGYYVCLTCVGIEEYLNGKGFSDYPLYGGTEKV